MIVPFLKNLERDNITSAYIGVTPTVSTEGGMGDAKLAEKPDAEGFLRKKSLSD
ncbi:hypothetical protein [Bacillus sp. NPDC077027]|uniref:hypothetical protein n=1 Tax=Bacillus sp. NPDC077027 TaxID=3390548 RepID=UPI003D0606AF